MQQHEIILKTEFDNLYSNFYKQILNPIKIFMFVSLMATLNFGFSQTGDILNRPEQEITLNEILDIAGKNSLDVFKAKHQYGINYWEFRSYRSSLLPKVNFNIEPLTYNRSFVQRYDSEQNIDVYREQQVLNSYANLSLSQNIRATGATVYINSSFNRLMNFGEDTFKNYNVTPVQIGFIQPLMAFNEFKWQHKTEPIKYKKSKKEYLVPARKLPISQNIF